MSRILYAVPLLLSALGLAQAAELTESTLALDPAAAQEPAQIPADTDDPVARKIHAQLRAPGTDGAARLPSSLVRGDSVLVEIRFQPGAGEDRAGQALARSRAEVRNTLSAELFEAVLPRSALYDLARDSDVVSIQPARLVRHHIGNRTSEGVAAGRANLWHANTPALNGSGIVVAVIDTFDNSSNEVNNLQASSDWPPDSRITLLNYKDAGAGCASFGCLDVKHGNATLEIVYDTAPGANFRAYDTVTVGDWRRAILDAANLNASGGSAGSVRAQIISASLGAPLDGKGDGTALAGSIAEAAGWARNRGVLVVNSAGNERQQHWGGRFDPATGANSSFHDWTGSNQIYNALGNGSGGLYCIPAGETVAVDMFWNNWLGTGANHNYDLYLYRRAASGSSWESLPVAQSTFPQNGGSGQTPQETLSFAASGTSSGCPANSSSYAVAVTRMVGTTATDNLQVFANVPLNERVPERSLGFPADSPNVVSVAAINVATAGNNPQEPFSSEGPVLASGGGLPSTSAATDPNLKPDVASFDNVSTVSYGVGGTNPPPATSFTGTSASAPHVAGMAALLMQRNGIPTSSATLDTLIVTPLRTLAATGSNDLGTPAGRDYRYGYGRLRFQRENTLAFQQQPGNTGVGDTLSPAIKVRLLDDEGLVVPTGLLAGASIAIGNYPNGGSAVLSGGGNAAFVQGIATWNSLAIDLGGIGYTLRATAGALPAVDSNAFNITTGSPSRLRFSQQPVTSQAGVGMTVTVRVEDSSGNLVTSDNATQVRLVRSTCDDSPVIGGAPRAVVAGVATFNNVILFTVGSSFRLQALAPSRSSDTSSAFNITANASLIFRSGMETCPQ